MTKSNRLQTTPVNTSHLQRLFIIRSLTIVAQISTMLFALYYLNINFHTHAVITCVVFLMLFNSYVWFRLRTNAPVTNNEIFFHLLVDSCALTVILYFSGGASNPFIALFLFPIIVSVTILPAKYAWILASINFACYTFLIFYFHPVGFAGADASHNHQPLSQAFNMHIFGMWIAFIFCVGFIAFFVMKMGNTIHEQKNQLLKIQETALRDQKIIALGTLAASTAHELGTPLGTMNLLVAELKEDLQTAPTNIQQDLDILKQQIDRCKQALSNLSASAGEVHLSMGSAALVEDFLQQILESWQATRPEIEVKCHWQNHHKNAKILNDLSLSQAITNILDNAADESPENIDWSASWNNSELIMEIRDRGQGLSDEIKSQLGKSLFSQKEQGLGLGLFLSHAIIERFGGEVRLFNRKGNGINVRITLPLLTDVG